MMSNVMWPLLTTLCNRFILERVLSSTKKRSILVESSNVSGLIKLIQPTSDRSPTSPTNIMTNMVGIWDKLYLRTVHVRAGVFDGTVHQSIVLLKHQRSNNCTDSCKQNYFIQSNFRIYIMPWQQMGMTITSFKHCTQYYTSYDGNCYYTYNYTFL